MRVHALGVLFLLATVAPLRAEDRPPAVTIENFGTVRLDVDFHGAERHLATETFWLRRSDDGDEKHKVLEQYSARSGRWTDSVKTDGFFPDHDTHTQFDPDALPFTKDFFRALNAALADGTLSRSTKLPAREGEKVTFRLTWNPKGHVPGHDEVVRIDGTLALGAEHALAFTPTDEAGKKVAPLLGLLLAQLDATNRAQDEVQKAVVLFGKVDAKGGLSLTETSWACTFEGPRKATEAKKYAVSADTDASLREVLARLDGRPVIVRAVLDEKGAAARVIGVLAGIGWKEPILATPGGPRSFATGGTLMNLLEDEAREVVSGRTGLSGSGVVAEVTHVDAKGGFARLRAPNRKGAAEPNAGYVKTSALQVITAAPDAKAYSGAALDLVLEICPPSETRGLTGKLEKR